MSARIARFGIAFVVVALLGGCKLVNDLASGEVLCAPSQSNNCPDGFQCIDPHGEGLTTCVRTACGDGVLARETEVCDDANANDDDLCHARQPFQIPDSDPTNHDDDDVAVPDDPFMCHQARFCSEAVPGLGIEASSKGSAQVAIGHPIVLASDPSGIVYVSSVGSNFIWRIERGAAGDGGERTLATRFAGNGSTVNLVAPGVDPLPNEISTPLLASMAADGVGNVIVADVQSNVIRRIDAVTGRVARIAGTGVAQTSQPGAVAAESPINQPISVAVDADGVVYFVERLADVTKAVRRINPRTGKIEAIRVKQIAGGTKVPFDGGHVRGIAFDGRDHLWMAVLDCPSRRTGPYRFGETEAPCFARGGSGNSGEVVDVDVAAGIAKPYSLQSCVPLLDDLDPGPFPESIIEGNQARLAVVPDGTAVYFPRGNRILRFDTTTDACTVIDPVGDGTAPGSCRSPVDAGQQVDNPLFSSGLADITLVRRNDATDGQDYQLLVADTVASVVRTVDVHEPAATDGAVAPHIGDVIGSCFDGDNSALIAEAVLQFTAESDGRIALAETNDCSVCNLAANTCVPRGKTDVERYDFFLPLPASHIVARIGCHRDVRVLAGSGAPGFDGDAARPAKDAALDNPVAATETLDGTVFIADADNHRVRRIHTYGADAPVGCTSGEPCIETFLPPCGGTRATNRCVYRPLGLAIDASGHLLVSDAGPTVDEGRILRVAVADDDDGFAVLKAPLREPAALLFLRYDFVPALLDLTGGQCTPATSSGLTGPPCGLLLFAERSGQRVRALTLPPLGALDLVVAGESLTVAAPEPGDDDTGPTTQARLRYPRGLMIDAPEFSGGEAASTTDVRLLVVDAIDRIRRVTIPVSGLTSVQTITSQRIESVVTTATASAGGAGFVARDDDAAGKGVLRSPYDIDFLDDGRLLVLDRVTGRLRVAAPLDDKQHAFALQTVSGLVDGVVPEGTTVPALDAAQLQTPEGLARDGDVVYVADTGAGRIRRVFVSSPSTAEWTTDVMPLVAGGRPVTLGAPAGLSVDPVTHDLYVADRARHVVYRVTAAGTVEVVAGQEGRRGLGGDAVVDFDEEAARKIDPAETYGARTARIDALCTPTTPPATEALLNAPQGVLFFRHRSGRPWLYVADTGNNRVRRVDLDGGGTITTVLGDGSFASGGAGPGASSPVAAPRGLATDRAGNLFVTSTNAIRFIGADSLQTLCSNAVTGVGVVDAADEAATVYGQDRSTVPETVTRCLVDVAVDPASQPGHAVVYAVDACIGMIVRFERTLDTCPAP